MTDYIVTRADESELEHHGVKGQKWGVKRYVKEAGFNRTSMYTHPIISAKSNTRNLIKHPLSAQYGGKAYLNDTNNEIRTKIAEKKSAKIKKNTGNKTPEVKSNASSRKSAKIKKATGKKMSEVKSNDSASLSTAELREKVNRLTLENQLRQQESIAHPAKKSVVKKVISQVGTELLRNVAHEAGQQVLKQVTTKVGPELMTNVANKAGQHIIKQALKNAKL